MNKMKWAMVRSERGIDWVVRIDGFARELKMQRGGAETSKVNADGRRHFPSSYIALKGRRTKLDRSDPWAFVL
jgi:hypothetical protein